MEFSSLDFFQGYPQTPPHYLCLLQLHSSPLNTISVPLWPQSSPTGLCFSLSPPPSPRETF